jgi:hypothetical protein
LDSHLEDLKAANITSLNVSLDNGLTFIETLSNPFQNGLLPAVGNALGRQTNLGNTITFFDQHPRTPYMQRWELSFQRELGSRLVAEVSYVGNRGTHIEVTRNINATPNEYLSTSPVRDQARIDYLSKLVPNPFVGLMPVTLMPSTIGRLKPAVPYALTGPPSPVALAPRSKRATSTAGVAA